MSEITLDFIAKQLERVLNEQAAMREDALVTNAHIGYVESSLDTVDAKLVWITAELRALRGQLSRLTRKQEEN
jgi:hypothetical protein